MTIFNSYLKLPEGTVYISNIFQDLREWLKLHIPAPSFPNRICGCVRFTKSAAPITTTSESSAWVIHIVIQTGCEFTGSGWDPWFSIRKWMLYKLGTQENLATDIKPIRSTLEKWHPPRSAFSKLWTVFFLRKSSPYLNGIMLKIEIKIFENNFQGMVPFF